MNVAERSQAIDSVIDGATKNLSAIRARLKSMSGVFMSHGWVVTSKHGFGMKFHIDGNVVSNPRLANMDEVTMFTQEDAATIAGGVVDGNGDAGVAMHVTDYLRALERSQEELVAQFTVAALRI